MSKNSTYAVVAVLVVIILVGGYVIMTNNQEPELMDIVDTAVEAGSFTTLATALEAADLIDTLKGDGPFTVFAPTDDAFDALPDGVLESLLDDIPALTDILTYHVVAGKYMAEDVISSMSLMSLQGTDLAIDTSDGVMIDGAMIVTTDIECSNGVIHVIDAVMIPEPELMDIVDTAVEAGSFTTLATALEAADLIDTLKGDGPFTVFAPTDDAFDALPDGVLESLLDDIPALTDILTYHVVAGKYMAEDVISSMSLMSLQGTDLAIDTSDGVMIDGAMIVTTDIECSNGVIHVIDAVMIPE